MAAENDPQQSNLYVDPDQLKPNSIIELVRGTGPRRRPFGKAEIQAAVFVLLVERDEPNLLFIRRAERGDPWSGQIAFPGGRVEDQDENTRQTAYRETFEEVAIPECAISNVADLGFFRTHLVPVDLHAYIGQWSGKDEPVPQLREVADIFEVPLQYLAGIHLEKGYTNQNATELWDNLTYPYDNTEIWGVTARIVHYLLELVITKFKNS